ncbi:PQQ-like beta-propeller repeat protein [Candidatus Poribacteria bacterium]|nr:PQQ-like beta-propeller repeat protein [Candidatus Poribacteria bacterium]
MTEWFDTGLKDEAEPPNLSNLYSGEYAETTNLIQSLSVKLAVSGKTVYVGKRDGHLFQSFDEGDTWNDLTLKLPFASVDFNAIVFAGSTVYVATNRGVAYSEDGTTWQAATDDDGGQLVMNRLIVEGATVYGIAGQHVYRLKENSDTWEQVTPEIPDIAFSLAIDANTLYVGTAGRGVLRFALDE